MKCRVCQNEMSPILKKKGAGIVVAISLISALFSFGLGLFLLLILIALPKRPYCPFCQSEVK